MQQLDGGSMKESYTWSAGNAIATVSTRECVDGKFRGICYIFASGKELSLSYGDEYGIGSEWTDPGRAVNDLAVILFHEIHKHEEIEDVDGLAELIARGRVSASSTHDFRHDPADDLIRDLWKSVELLDDESFGEIADEKMVAGNISALETVCPKTYKQMNLFGDIA
jgi:hypothetical protein